MTMFYLYIIVNKENNKVYIGQTNNPNLRWSQHKSSAKYHRGGQIITKAISKYGASSFEFKVIAQTRTQIDADAAETQLIAQYDSRNHLKGYNISAGGNSPTRTPEVAKKISESLKKYYETHENPRKGIPAPEEWKINMSKAAMGKPGTNTGKTFDEEWAIGISKSLAGKPKEKKRRFSEEEEKEICRLYKEEEKSTYALEKQFDCCRSLIKDILVRNNVPIRQSNYTGHSNSKNRFTVEQELEICEKYKEGNISRTELSKKYNCGKTTIRSILIRYNIKI